MTVGEWWAEYDLRAPAGEEKFAGKLTRDDVDELRDWMNERTDNG
jgi:hypothetical protein